MTAMLIRNARLPGEGLVEYALVGACVLVIGMVGLANVGQQISDLLGGFQHHLEVSAQSAIDQAGSPNAAVPGAQSAMAQDTLYINPANVDQLCGPNFCIYAPGFSRATVSTVGSNGTMIDSAADIYSQLARILEAQGADPETIALLTHLAQQGHQLGDAESLLHGKTYSNMKKGVDGLANGVGSFKAMAGELTANIDNYPPEVRALLKDASRVIIGIADSYHVSKTVSSAGNNRVKYVQNIYKIQLTHYKSNVICSNGGDESQCVR